MNSRAAPRWAISLADLTMLLLAFFVLLRSTEESALVTAAQSAFGSGPVERVLLRSAGSSLFEASEARLRPEARRQLAAIGKACAVRGQRLVVESLGQDPAKHRFDGWELAAARTAAVARALAEGGMPQSRIRIVVPPARGKSGRAAQILTVYKA